MYKSEIWKFSNLPVRSIYETMLSPRDDRAMVIQSQDSSGNGFADPIAKLVGQSFLFGFSEELHTLGFIAERLAMRSGIGTEKLREGRNRTRVELDVVVEVPQATQNQLIDALSAAKRKCSAFVGPHVKIVLKAELKMAQLPPSVSPVTSHSMVA
jgi:hypothetical protein